VPRRRPLAAGRQTRHSAAPPAVGPPPRRASPSAGKGPPARRHVHGAAGRRCPRHGEPPRATAATHAAAAVIHETRSRSGSGRVGEGTHSRTEKASPPLSSRPHGLPAARSSSGEVRRKWRRGRRGAAAVSARAGDAGAEKTSGRLAFRPCCASQTEPDIRGRVFGAPSTEQEETGILRGGVPFLVRTETERPRLMGHIIFVRKVDLTRRRLVDSASTS